MRRSVGGKLLRGIWLAIRGGEILAKLAQQDSCETGSAGQARDLVKKSAPGREESTDPVRRESLFPQRTILPLFVLRYTHPILCHDSLKTGR